MKAEIFGCGIVTNLEVLEEELKCGINLTVNFTTGTPTAVPFKIIINQDDEYLEIEENVTGHQKYSSFGQNVSFKIKLYEK